MKCPNCGGNTGIWKTRAMPNGSVLRERRCSRRACAFEFVTVEQMRLTLGKRISVARVRKRRPKS